MKILEYLIDFNIRGDKRQRKKGKIGDKIIKVDRGENNI